METTFKKRIGYTSLLILFLGFLGFYLYSLFPSSTQLVNAVKSRYINDFTNKRNWKIKLNNHYTIPKSSLEQDQSFLVRWFSSPDDVKRNLTNETLRKVYMENALNQNLLIVNALSKGMLDSKEFDQYLWISVRDAIVQYYLIKEMGENKSAAPKITVSKEEINALYKKFEASYDSLGFSKEKAFKALGDILLKQKAALIIQKRKQKVIDKLKLKNKVEIAD